MTDVDTPSALQGLSKTFSKCVHTRKLSIIDFWTIFDHQFQSTSAFWKRFTRRWENAEGCAKIIGKTPSWVKWKVLIKIRSEIRGSVSTEPPIFPKRSISEYLHKFYISHTSYTYETVCLQKPGFWLARELEFWENLDEYMKNNFQNFSFLPFQKPILLSSLHSKILH